MKSKIYSSRYMKVSSKGMLWIPAFITIGFLLAFPVAELIMLGNWFGRGYSTEQISLLYENLWRDGFMITGLVVIVLAACLNGISQFWYLYSARKIDFYHSLPVKRKRMFWCKLLQSLLYFLLPYLVMEFFSVCIGAMRGFFSLHLMKMAFLLLVLHLLLYLLLYFFVVLVICLTGHYLMGALFFVAVMAYGPVLSLLISLCENTFYYTYTDVLSGIPEILMKMASPVMLAGTFAQRYAQGNYGGVLGLVILLTVVVGVLGYYTYVHRKSERTGKAFIYDWVGTLVRFLVVIPTGLGVGLVFYLLPTDSSRGVWWVFGIILGTILSWGILEIIYYMDFRKFFSHKLQMVVCGVFVAACTSILYFDLTGYDNYIPPVDQIENIAIGSFFNLGGEHPENLTFNEDGTVSLRTDADGMSSESYDIGIDSDIYSCMENIKKQSLDICKTWGVTSTVWKANMWDSTGETVRIPVRYELKSGKCIYRSYMINRDNMKELLQVSYEQGTIKEQKYSILQVDDKYMSEVACTFADGQTISLFQDNRAKKEQLMEAFRQDIKEASAEAMLEDPCAVLSMIYPKVPAKESVSSMIPGGGENTYYLSAYLYVFPQFERTVEILKETGYPISMEEVNVTSVEVQYYMNEEKTEYSSPVIYDDPGELEELKKVLKCYSFIPVWENPESDNRESLKVRINGQESDDLWKIPEKDIPEFMQEDAQRALAFEVIEEE